MYGMQTSAAGLSMSGNTVRNMTGNSNGAGLVVMSGFSISAATATEPVSLSRNTVHSLSNASGAASTSIHAVDLTLPASANVTANVVERNFIHSISNTSTNNTSQVIGLIHRGSATAGVPVTATMKNNMIRLGVDAAGNSLTPGLGYVGIFDAQGATGGVGTTFVSYYFNSVYVGGTGVASSSNTFAFQSSALTSTRAYVDNIFWNARSNASGTGKNYAINVAGTAPNPAGLTSNYNDLLATGTGGFVGQFNGADQATVSDWRTATGQDANSISADPRFVNPTGTASTVDLHISTSAPISPVSNAGTPVTGTTNDYDGDTRDAATPDIGADEFTPPNTAPVAAASPNPATTDEDTPVQITLVGTDADDNNLIYTITDAPDHGNLTGQSATPNCAPVGTCTLLVTYTPAANYNGADFFKFKVNDGTANSNEVTVNINVNAVADLSVSDAAAAEGNSGTTAFTFTVTLDSPAPAGGVTFNASTYDGATDPANSGSDYEGFSLQPHSIPEGQTSTTVTVQVNGDTTQEPNETFVVSISNPTNATIQDGEGQGTILNDDGAPSAGQIIISEFRLRGPGAGPTPSPADEANDEFIELYNTTDSNFVVADTSPLAVSTAGWAVVSSDAPATPKAVVPAGTTIPARGHILVANLGYTLSLYPAGRDTLNNPTYAVEDVGYNTDIPDGAGLALFRTNNPGLFAAPAERLDSVGFTGALPPFFETTPLAPMGGITTSAQHSFLRRLESGVPQDTQDNATDFVLVSTAGGTLDGVQTRLGAPGPENTKSPIQRNGLIKARLVDATVPQSSAPNRVRDNTVAYDDTLSGTGTYSLGTLSIRRRFVNNTGSTVARLRVRLVNVTSGPAPTGTADLRAISSAQITVKSNDPTVCPDMIVPEGGCDVLLKGTTLETPPAQSQGGGYNSTLSVDLSVAPIAPGGTADVQMLLGVRQGGTFRFFGNIEILTSSQLTPANTQQSAAPLADGANAKQTSAEPGKGAARRKH
jgi:hypothetical protein